MLFSFNVSYNIKLKRYDNKGARTLQPHDQEHMGRDPQDPSRKKKHVLDHKWQ